MCDVWWQYRHRQPEELNPINEPSRFLVTVYATWANIQIGRRNSDARPATTQRGRTTMDIYGRYDEAFTVERVLRECEATRGDFTMRIECRPFV